MSPAQVGYHLLKAHGAGDNSQQLRGMPLTVRAPPGNGGSAEYRRGCLQTTQTTIHPFPAREDRMQSTEAQTNVVV